MADRPLDEGMEKLVALLYGELPLSEERALRERIEREPDLRAAWEDLTAARSFLQQAPEDEEAPRFVFLNDEPAEPRRSARWRRIRALPSLAPWAAAAAAVLVAVFAWSEARHARLEAGRAVAAVGAPAAEFVRRDELGAYTKSVTETMTALLNEYGRRRDEELSNVFLVALSELAERQRSDYRDLRGRIENAAFGLAEEQFRTNLQVEYLMKEDQRPVRPGRGSTRE